MYYLPYNKNLKEFARYLRKNSTPGEINLWMQVRASTLGYQFYRQRIIATIIIIILHNVFQMLKGRKYWKECN
jgi:very-short-patch-repair endonuclease